MEAGGASILKQGIEEGKVSQHAFQGEKESQDIDFVAAVNRVKMLMQKQVGKAHLK